LLIGHQFPDGDAVGSVLGLALMLERAGRKVQATWAEPFEMPEKYAFLPGTELLVRPADLMGGHDLTIALDCANEGRLEELRDRAFEAPIINIDHHPDNTSFGAVNLVDHEASATSQIVYKSAALLGLAVDDDVAVCLYTGIVTDTGRFQFSNTTGETLRIAGALIEKGVKPHTIFQNVYQSDSLAYLRLSGEMLCRAVYETELGLIHGYVSRDDLTRFGVKMNETEDLIDNLRTLRGHRVAALFKQLADGTIRVSLRSRLDVDIGSVARSLGGGGHRVAAGYTSGKRTFEDALQELKGEIIARGCGPDDK
ncbi:MAG: DHH family phosphoesterase, partial [Candidatus Geothermincolia bacterium]